MILEFFQSRNNVDYFSESPDIHLYWIQRHKRLSRDCLSM